MCIRDRYALSEVFAKGGEGGVELAKTVCKVIDENPESHFAPIVRIFSSTVRSRS